MDSVQLSNYEHNQEKVSKTLKLKQVLYMVKPWKKQQFPSGTVCLHKGRVQLEYDQKTEKPNDVPTHEMDMKIKIATMENGWLKIEGTCKYVQYIRNNCLQVYAWSPEYVKSQHKMRAQNVFTSSKTISYCMLSTVFDTL